MRTVEFEQDTVRLIDQLALPAELRVVACRTVAEVADAIRRMVVRGAPAIGVTAAFGMVLGAREYAGADAAGLLGHLERVAAELKATRPTAVNLAWAVDRLLLVARAVAERTDDGAFVVDRVRAELEAAARAMVDADVAANRLMGAHGAELVPSRATILTHCNAGALATVDYGTALGVVRGAVEAGKQVHVLVDETRPYLQGARLTAWELQQDNIPLTLITDSMAGSFMARGEVDLVVVGADRIAANGDVANKIGTYTLAVLCKEHGIPFYVAAPTSTIDLALASGADIPIEQRSAEEVTHLAGQSIAPDGVAAAHPAFDVTPAQYVTAIVTEQGVHRAPYEVSLREAVDAAERAEPPAGDAPSAGRQEVEADAPVRA